MGTKNKRDCKRTAEMKRGRYYNKIIYYTDECHEEFSGVSIVPKRIDENYHYFHGRMWDFLSFLMQNILSLPIKFVYAKVKFRIKFVGREKFKCCKDRGYFIYANHTQPFGDTFIPSLANFPKRNFFIVSPENVSMPGFGGIVELLGAVPVPCDFKGMKNFLTSIEQIIQKNDSITIYPEAHIWPYYIHIRPFGAVSFRYPVMYSSPVFVLTNTYHSRGRGNKVQIITYIDGPFYPDESLKFKERQQKLRDKVYECMISRSKESDFEYIKYKKRT